MNEQQRTDFERDLARQRRELDQRKRALQEEAELRKRELDNAQKLQKQKDEMDNLQAEVHLREQEQMRADLGSNCNSEIGHQHDAPMYVNQLKDMDGYSSRRNVTNWLNDYKSDNCLPENQLPNKKPSAIHATHVDKCLFGSLSRKSDQPPPRTV